MTKPTNDIVTTPPNISYKVSVLNTHK